MRSKYTGSKEASCSVCPSTFTLVPPADTRYIYPREKPVSEDYIQRIYECVDENHQNRIYWEKESKTIFIAGKDPRDDFKDYPF